MEQDFMRMVPSDTLVMRCVETIAKSFKKMNIEQFQNVPKNLLHLLLKVLSKRGYIDDNNIHLFLSDSTKTLEVGDCACISDTGLEKLKAARYLAKLDLNSNSQPRTNVSSQSLCALFKNLKYLQVVQLRRCVHVDDRCIDVLASSCPRLASLNLGNCPSISDQALASLGRNCRNLCSVNFSGTNITDNGIFALMTEQVSHTLEEVHISHCNLITDASIECILMHSRKIKYLLFHSCPKTTDASRLALEEYMSNSQNQKVKHLSWTVY